MSETLLAVLDECERGRCRLIVPDDGTEITGPKILAGVRDVARTLSRAGVRRGDRVSIVLENGPEVVQVLLAVASLGAAAAPLNPAYTREECRFYLQDLLPRVLIAPGGGGSAAREAAPLGTLILDADLQRGSVALYDSQHRLTRSTPPELVAPDDIALLLHTSGTTGRQKQVPLLHRNLMASSRAIAEHYMLSADDVSFAAMPLFHVHGLVASVLAPLISGGTVAVPRRLVGGSFWDSVAVNRVSWYSGSPTLLTMLLDRRPAGSQLPALRFVRSCSAPLSGELFDRIERNLEVPLLQAYGMTEASHQIASNPLPPGRRGSQTVGLPTGTQVATLDEDGAVLPWGTEGEVAIKGPGLTPGYLDNPEANAQAFVGGWFRTGDRGVVDADGYLSLTGRIKELIIRGGENISPYEVEDVLQRHPAVIDAACFAVPDDKYGQVVGGAVVLGRPTEPREILSFCRERLAPFKVPAMLQVVQSLPKTATGKVQRQQLMKQYAELR